MAVLIPLAFFITTVLYDAADLSPTSRTHPPRICKRRAPRVSNGPVLNNYNFGGFLIFSGVPVFIDGRADLYGDDFIRGYGGIMGGGKRRDCARRSSNMRSSGRYSSPKTAFVRLLDRLPGLGACVCRQIRRRPPADRPAELGRMVGLPSRSSRVLWPAFALLATARQPCSLSRAKAGGVYAISSPSSTGGRPRG